MTASSLARRDEALDAQVVDGLAQDLVERARRPAELRARLPRIERELHAELLPLSDYGRDGAPITYKAWACSNPDCGFNLRIDNGELSYGRTVGTSQK